MWMPNFVKSLENKKKIETKSRRHLFRRQLSKVTIIFLILLLLGTSLFVLLIWLLYKAASSGKSHISTGLKEFFPIDSIIFIKVTQIFSILIQLFLPYSSIVSYILCGQKNKDDILNKASLLRNRDL